MTSTTLPPLSVLDLCPIVEGGTAQSALNNALDLARHTEALGYQRYWMAEHHNMDGVASSATSVLIGYVAGGTKTIRVGSGGVMLPNHAPLVIAEQFGTLATLYPGRIDLGLGRAPGTDRMTMRALRRHLNTNEEEGFVDDVVELYEYFRPPEGAPRAVRAIPGIGCDVPMWLLGSSLYSAQVAAMMGLPFAFASHFAPALLMNALELYRNTFRASGVSGALTKPYAMVGVNVCAAETDEDATVLFTTIQQRFLGMQRDQRRPLQPPVKGMDSIWNHAEQLAVERMLQISAVGSATKAKARLHEIAHATQADELILASAIYDHDARKRSYALVAN